MFGRPDIASIVEERIERVPLEIEIAPGKTGSDISYYVQRSVRTRLSSLPLALKNHIVDVLRQKANGVFLWVRITSARSLILPDCLELIQVNCNRWI